MHPLTENNISGASSMGDRIVLALMQASFVAVVGGLMENHAKSPIPTPIPIPMATIGWRLVHTWLG